MRQTVYVWKQEVLKHYGIGRRSLEAMVEDGQLTVHHFRFKKDRKGKKLPADRGMFLRAQVVKVFGGGGGE